MSVVVADVCFVLVKYKTRSFNTEGFIENSESDIKIKLLKETFGSESV